MKLYLLFLMLNGMLFAEGVHRFKPKAKFRQCARPSLIHDCSPFRTNAKWDWQRIKIIKEGFKKGFGRTESNCVTSLIRDNSTAALTPMLTFNVYKNGEFVEAVNGRDFTTNPYRYLCAEDRDSQTNRKVDIDVLFIMAGIFTDCKANLTKIGNLYEWRTSIAHELHSTGLIHTAVIINWGELSCINYNCLCMRAVYPMGELLGTMFAAHFVLSRLTLVGQSLAGHVFAKACHTARDQMGNGDRIAKFIGLDIAGPLVGDRKFIIWYLIKYEPKLIYNVDREMADKTILVYTNPQDYGSNETNPDVHVQIHVNEADNYRQPGAPTLLKSVYYHAFASMLGSGMAAKIKCQGTRRGGSTPVDLNVFHNNIDDGIYTLPTTFCWPFCCAEVNERI